MKRTPRASLAHPDKFYDQPFLHLLGEQYNDTEPMDNDRRQLRQWLGLTPQGDWPPSAEELLGYLCPQHTPQQTLALSYEELEARVLDCIEKLRPYQVKYPELVTEAMNCLAQALLLGWQRTSAGAGLLLPNTSQDRAVDPNRADSSNVQVADVASLQDALNSEDALQRLRAPATSSQIRTNPSSPSTIGEDIPLSMTTAVKPQTPAQKGSDVPNSLPNDVQIQALSIHFSPPTADRDETFEHPSREAVGELSESYTPLVPPLPNQSRPEPLGTALRGHQASGATVARGTAWLSHADLSLKAEIRRLVRLRRLWRLWRELAVLWRTDAWLEHPFDLIRFMHLQSRLHVAMSRVVPPWSGNPGSATAWAAALLMRSDAVAALHWLTPKQKMQFLIAWRQGEQHLAEAYHQLSRKLEAIRRSRGRWSGCWTQVAYWWLQPETWGVVAMICLICLSRWYIR
jgi:hypothetical protein